jgi:hypothetical protein
MRTHWNLAMATTLVLAFGAPAVAGMMGQTPPSGSGGGTGAGAMGHMMHHGMMEHGGRMGSHEGPLLTMMLHHSQDLGLSPEQEQTLRDLRTAFEKEAVRRTAEIRVLQIDVDALLEQERWDLAQLEPKVRQVAALQGELRIARLKTLAAGRALLTPQQLEKLKQIGHHGGSMGGPGGMGHGMMGPSGAGSPGRGGPAAQPHAH